MPTAVRPAARPAPRPRTPVRPDPAPAPRPHAAAPEHQRGDTLRMIAIIAAVVVAAVVGITIIWEFGAARLITRPGGLPGSQIRGGEAAAPAPTLYYRDLRDGRVMVMEVDENGTRIKGTMSRNDVPLTAELYHEETRRSSDTPTSSQRINALGSSFR